MALAQYNRNHQQERQLTARLRTEVLSTLEIDAKTVVANTGTSTTITAHTSSNTTISHFSFANNDSDNDSNSTSIDTSVEPTTNRVKQRKVVTVTSTSPTLQTADSRQPTADSRQQKTGLTVRTGTKALVVAGDFDEDSCSPLSSLSPLPPLPPLPPANPRRSPPTPHRSPTQRTSMQHLMASVNTSLVLFNNVY
jgi:hypothetical protein